MSPFDSAKDLIAPAGHRQRRSRVRDTFAESGNASTIDWQPSNSEAAITRSEYSVDGALALLTNWRRKTANGGDSSRCVGGNSCDGSFVPKGTIHKGKLIEYLKQFIMVLLLELLRARQQIAFLESEVERLKKAHGYAPAPYRALPPLSLGKGREQWRR